MLIAVPSKGRAGSVIATQKRLPNCTIFVPGVEFDAYEKSGNKNLVPVPDNILGITKTRNWILKNTNEKWVVFIDDDVVAAGFIELNDRNAKPIKLNEGVFLKEFYKLFELTEDMGYRIWGIATDGAPRSVYPYKPFIFQTYVTASCMGIVNNNMFFNENFPVKEDYEMCLRCIMEDGGIIGARYIYWANDHWHKEGGCKDYRTNKMESAAIDKLIDLYPGYVTKAKDRKGEFCITLNF